MLMGILLLPRSENVWPETFTWKLALDVGFGFVIVTLLTTDTPTPTSPKLTVPGVTWTRASETDAITPDPQPDAATIKQQTTAGTKIVHRRSSPGGRVPAQTRSLFGLGKLPWEGREGVAAIASEEAGIAHFNDTKITSWAVQENMIRGRAKGKER
jgi:hypothetical protein